MLELIVFIAACYFVFKMQRMIHRSKEGQGATAPALPLASIPPQYRWLKLFSLPAKNLLTLEVVLAGGQTIADMDPGLLANMRDSYERGFTRGPGTGEVLRGDPVPAGHVLLVAIWSPESRIAPHVLVAPHHLIQTGS